MPHVSMFALAFVSFRARKKKTLFSPSFFPSRGGETETILPPSFPPGNFSPGPVHALNSDARLSVILSLSHRLQNRMNITGQKKKKKSGHFLGVSPSPRSLFVRHPSY